MFCAFKQGRNPLAVSAVPFSPPFHPDLLHLILQKVSFNFAASMSLFVTPHPDSDLLPLPFFPCGLTDKILTVLKV